MRVRTRELLEAAEPGTVVGRLATTNDLSNTVLHALAATVTGLRF